MECSYGKIFIPVNRSQKPGSRLPGQPGFSNEHIEIFYKGKSGEAKFRKPRHLGWPGSYEEAHNEPSLPPNQEESSALMAYTSGMQEVNYWKTN